MSDPSIIPLDSAQESLDKADAEGKEEPEPPISSPPSSPHFSRSLSSANFSPNGDLYDGLDEDWLLSTDVGELSLFDFLDSLSFIPVTLDKFNQRIKLQSREIRNNFRNRTSRYRERTKLGQSVEKLRTSLDRSLSNLQGTWNDGKSVSTRDKIAFCSAVGNIFITAFLLGWKPDKLPIWYTAQMIYYMPLRYFSFRRKGYHYFIADLCYWVNLMLNLFLWVFPSSQFLLIATYCLANGPVAWAIIAWRNSLVFHSFEKVVSLFIHIMPPVVLHTILHLLPPGMAQERYPALAAVHQLGIWRSFWISTLVHTIWQTWYYLFIMVRRAEKIAAGRPTSFTWLRRSYAKTWIGKWVNSLPESVQPISFMGIQYVYSLLTMIPSPLLYNSKVLSVLFVTGVFGWSVWNGATYYVDVFGKRFEKELADLRREVEKWQNSPLNGGNSGTSTPYREIPKLDLEIMNGEKLSKGEVEIGMGDKPKGD